jgi:hypothetical protein
MKPILYKLFQKMEAEAESVAHAYNLSYSQSQSPEFQPQYCQKEQRKWKAQGTFPTHFMRPALS